jgi:ribosomal protein L21E
MKAPTKLSDAEAMQYLASKAKDKSLSMAERSKYEREMSRYAKGGDVKAKLTPKQTKKVGKVMGEFKDKTLHSGKGGKVVKDSKQAIAIALSVASRAKKK